MIVAVVGLGSMGKRRIRNIRELYPHYCILGVDNNKERQEIAHKQFQIKCFGNLNEINEMIDCVFVCSAPLTHGDIIHDALKRKCNVFTELNLTDYRYDENIALARANECTLFLSSTFLYRQEIQYVRKKVISETNWNYMYHVGQYLPTWHPWEDYKRFFIGEKQTSGCREILAIELPWLIDTFGTISSIQVQSDKITSLDISYNDNYLILLTHDSGNKGCLIVDVVSPIPVRHFEAYGENKFISWAGTPETLYSYSDKIGRLETVKCVEKNIKIEGYSEFVSESAYTNEVLNFFETIEGKGQPRYSFEKDKAILKLIDLIEAKE